MYSQLIRNHSMNFKTTIKKSTFYDMISVFQLNSTNIFKRCKPTKHKVIEL